MYFAQKSTKIEFLLPLIFENVQANSTSHWAYIWMPYSCDKFHLKKNQKQLKFILLIHVIYDPADHDPGYCSIFSHFHNLSSFLFSRYCNTGLGVEKSVPHKYLKCFTQYTWYTAIQVELFCLPALRIVNNTTCTVKPVIFHERLGFTFDLHPDLTPEG